MKKPLLENFAIRDSVLLTVYCDSFVAAPLIFNKSAIFLLGRVELGEFI